MHPKTNQKLQKILAILAGSTVLYCVFMLDFTDHINYLIDQTNSVFRIYERLKMEKLNESLHGDPIKNSDPSWSRIININYPIDKWQAIGDPDLKFKMYAAYFDERLEIIENYDCPIDHICYGSVRVITLLHYNLTNQNIFCNLRYQDGSEEQLKAHSVQQINDPDNYRTYMIVCILQRSIHQDFKTPEAIGISYKNHSSMAQTTSLTAIRYPKLFNRSSKFQSQNNGLLVCVPAFQGNYSKVLRIVEFIEIYKLMGAYKFYFYNASISQDVDRVLRYYVENDNVEVLDWNTDYSDYDIFYQGISACFNDCYYRASFIDNAKYIALQDIDEIMMPLDNNTKSLHQFIEQIDKPSYHSFSFHNVFMQKLADNETLIPVNSTGIVQKLYSNRYFRKTGVFPYHVRSKMIAKGKKLEILSNHFYLKSVKNTTEREIEPSEGLLLHYRISSRVENTTEEFAARKYMDSLMENVNRVCMENFRDGVCP